MNESYKNNQSCEKDERVIRYNMEKCASFMAKMILKYGKEVLEEINAENEKMNVSVSEEKN
ncbi:MAG: hypothetical protein LUC95_02105 [Lachnospiraceae bacterium]|nr:hypothetical protein [Lachnospiraceae bacterium]